MTFAPAFILVRPQLGENIGAAARVMKNFGFSDLRIVAPRDGWPNPAAESMAAGGLDVLQGARLYDSTRAAISDLSYVYATTARPREMEKRVISAHALFTDLVRADAMSYPDAAQDVGHTQTGFLFGPERSGLENEDIVQADCILYVPVNPEYPSLNLAQTVALVAYECSKIMAGATQPSGNNAPQGFYTQGHHPEHLHSALRPEQMPASKDELFSFFDHLHAELDARNFWKVAAKKTTMWINIRNLFTRAGLTQQEVRTLRGIVRSLCER